MNILITILAILIILGGLLLCVAQPILGIVFVAFGILLLVVIRHKKKIESESRNTINQPLPPQAVQPTTVATPPVTKVKPDGIPSRKHVFTKTFKVSGVTFKCHEDSGTNRQEILSNMNDGDVLDVKKYKYKGDPAYLLIDQTTGNDIGNIPANIAETIADQYPNNDIEAYVADVDSFWADDKEEEIYTCKVKLYVLENRSL